MNSRLFILSIIACLISTAGFAQSTDPYQVPRTEYGQPDFQGVWSTVFHTMLERPGEMPLVLGPEQAAGFAAVVSQNLGDNNDPDVDMFGPPTLAKVNGEFRSSIVVYPQSGVLPYNELGTEMSSYDYFKAGEGFDHPEERPGVERCIEAWGSPPMRAFMYQLFHGFVQTPDKIAIVSEEAVALRVIHMDGSTRPDTIRSFEGHSIGHWEGDTLVVETTHYSDVNPARATIRRPMLISSAARVTERFTRTSDSELNYQYTVDDPTYYTEPWKGEFSFTRDPSGHIYEYACHEGNYSMVGALRGARAQEAQAAAQEAASN
ncbi:MAG: hypothetical protein DHS20C12_18650 [Pseudohongiella sp.]|nr:MAG: hypothetical protein DHS20C12_18650 [Pseudohongiella sp.]